MAGVFNPDGLAPLVLICEHASNHVPPEFAGLGLSEAERHRHIAWDPGALSVAQVLARLLDAPLVHANVSRLVIDLNRAPEDSDAIAEVSETTVIPGNLYLSPTARDKRVAAYYQPFHRVLADVIASRNPRALISVHSFTPAYKGVHRPWHVGLITDAKSPLAANILANLALDAALVTGLNVPYAPSDRVYHTLDLHARNSKTVTAMVEIRNDLICDVAGQLIWGQRLASAIKAGLAA